MENSSTWRRAAVESVLSPMPRDVKRGFRGVMNTEGASCQP
jgi:hypothetical protein